jgi:hypothetical protein
VLKQEHRQAAHTDAADAYEMKSFARKSVKSVSNHFPSSPGSCGRLMYPYVCPEHISSLKITLKTGFDKLTAGKDFNTQKKTMKEKI